MGSGSYMRPFIGVYRILKGLCKAIWGPLKSYIRLYTALQRVIWGASRWAVDRLDNRGLYRAFKGLYRAFQRLYRAFERLYRVFKGLYRAFKGLCSAL